MSAGFYLLLAACSAWLASDCFRTVSRRMVRCLAAMVLWAVFVIVPVHLAAVARMAGWITQIRLWPLAVAQLLILMLCVVAVVRRRLLTGHHHEGVSRPAHPVPLGTQEKARHIFPTYIWVCMGALAASYAVFGANLASSYPTGWDALAYHLPVALRWMQTGTMSIPSYGSWQYALPGNAEVGMMLLLSMGRQWLAAAVNLVAALGMAGAVYLVAGKVTRKPGVAEATSIVALSLPIVEFQAFSAYVDLFGTAFLFVSLALFLYRRESTAEKTNGVIEPTGSSALILLLSGLACGIAVGTKPVFYAYAAVLCAGVAVTLIWESGRRWLGSMAAISLFAMAVLVPSLFWFGRGFVQTNNPVFPLQFKVGSHVVFKGFAPSEITPNEFSDKFVRQRAEWLVYPWTEWLRNPGEQLIPYSEGSGLGAAFAAFVPFGVLWAGYQAVRGRGAPILRILTPVGLGLLAVWWVGLQRMPRFGLPLWLLGCVCAVPLFELLDGFTRRGYRSLLVACVVATCVTSLFVPLRQLAARTRSHRWKRCHVYAYPQFFDNLPEGTGILNDTGIEEANFSLAGEKLTNRVVADFELQDPITSQFLKEHRIDFIAEAFSEKADAPEMHKVTQVLAPTVEVWSEVNGGKRWRVLKVEASQPQPTASAP
jgi:hypothetical protein